MTETPQGSARSRGLLIGALAVAGGLGLAGLFVITGGERLKDKAALPGPAGADTAQIALPEPDPLLSTQSTTPPDGTAQSSLSGQELSAPTQLAFSDQDLDFIAILPPESGNGLIIARLRAELENRLADLRKQAREEQAMARAAGAPGAPWEYQIRWSVLARSGDLISLAGTFFEFTGGAHGLETTQTRIARISTGDTLDFTAMMRFAQAPSPALVIAACEALKAEKRQRINAVEIIGEPVVCAGPAANVRLEDASIALAPSTLPGKFGGVYIFFDPYTVGAYVEGPYALVISQEVFADDLRPEYRALFAGAPVPLKKT